MPFVDGFQYDVFISYSHADNEGREAWVSSFRAAFETRLKELTSKDAWIFFDPNLQRNSSYDRQIKAAVESSAVLLVVLTENYLRSQYCEDERTWFFDNLRGGRFDASRACLVLPDPIKPDRKPERFAKLLGQVFYATPAGGRFPIRLSLGPEMDDDCKRAYATAFNDLAWETAYILEELRRDAGGGEIYKARPKVFVAETTDDLENKRSDLSRYLKQAGYSIVPFRQHNRADIAAYRAEMSADAAEAIAFVQLLSPLTGRQPDALKEGFPWLQHEIARERRLPIYQWKPEGFSIPEGVPEAHRALLSGAFVKAGGIEIFKAWLVERLSEPAPTAPPPKDPAKPAVYISFDKPDRSLADGVATLLKREGFDVDLSLEEGSSEELRKDLTDGMSYCDGLLVVYGDTKPSWIKGQYREGRKILAQRPTPAKALALLQGPPPGKPDPGIRSDLWRILEAHEGITIQALSPFVDQLRGTQ